MLTTEAADSLALDRDELLDLLRQMLLMRRFDERMLALRRSCAFEGVVHPYFGQEAVAAGVGAHLGRSDKITSTHRGHGHCIAKGADVRLIAAELYGRRDGYSRGKGGSMHLADAELGILGSNGIVGAGIPIATGAALALSMQGGHGVAVTFFGDGACGTGALHESLNIASLWSLPVVFVAEDNGWASNTPVEMSLAAEGPAAIASAHRVVSEVVDGNDVLAVFDAAGRAVRRARECGGPSLIEARTFRLSEHAYRDEPVMPDHRDPDVVAAWRLRDPIDLFARTLVERRLLDGQTLAHLDASVSAEVEDAVAFAEASPFPEPEEALEGLFTLTSGGNP